LATPPPKTFLGRGPPFIFVLPRKVFPLRRPSAASFSKSFLVGCWRIGSSTFFRTTPLFSQNPFSHLDTFLHRPFFYILWFRQSFPSFEMDMLLSFSSLAPLLLGPPKDKERPFFLLRGDFPPRSFSFFPWKIVFLGGVFPSFTFPFPIFGDSPFHQAPFFFSF